VAEEEVVELILLLVRTVVQVVVLVFKVPVLHSQVERELQVKEITEVHLLQEAHGQAARVVVQVLQELLVATVV
jgi:hypothetical protein